MTCLIVDDNPMARLALRNMTSDIGNLELVGECDSAVQAYNFLNKTPVDLLLLDVEMPGMSGLDLLKSLDHPPLVVLITAKSDYATESFDLEVVDYIVKPVTQPRLLKALHRAGERHNALQVMQSQGDDTTYLFVRVNNQFMRIDFDDILFVQAMGDYVKFQTAQKMHAVHMTMKAAEDRLPVDRFMRVHRSYIVALNKIESLEQNSIQIDTHVIPVSENFKQTLLERMNVL